MKSLVVSLLCLSSGFLFAQTYSYNLSLESIAIPNLGGIQSYAFGQYEDEWLIIGGRLDGLHQRQPFAAFDEAGNNNNLIVVNPITKQTWKSDLNNLSSSLQEQLSSANMQFFQEGNALVLTGGYAYSPSANDHITFPMITVLNVKEVIAAVKTNSISQNEFIQKRDESFAVTGGQLEKINDNYYLVGGHRFDGRYNPMGPDHGPGFEQEYTNEIRKFKIDFLENDFTITQIETIHDERHLHRRDYNLLPQINNGEEELMIFSGVFQNDSDIPWLYPVSISSNSYEAHIGFTQHFNHYHCASIPIYNTSEDEMHNIFFGGIAQFYMENGTLVQDNDVPFVKTIADVSRSKDGSMTETIFDLEMPGMLGAGAEFIPLQNIPSYENGVIRGDQLESNFINIGYIFGGIDSNAPNIFFTNNGTQSIASNSIYKVGISKSLSTSAEDYSFTEMEIMMYPNPAQNIVRMVVELESLEDIDVEIFNASGSKLGTQSIQSVDLKVGKNYLILNSFDVSYGAFFYKIKIGEKTFIRKVLWTE